MSYRYRCTIYKNGYDKEFGNVLSKVKAFMGNDKNILAEKAEIFINKSSIDRNDLSVRIEEVQHAWYC